MNVQRFARGSVVLPGLILLSGTTVGLSLAAEPPAVNLSMTLTQAGDYHARSERVVRPGWVVDTFDSATATVRVFGRASSSVSFGETLTQGESGTASASVTAPSDGAKSGLEGDGAAVDAAPGAVEALIALGVDPKVALDQFGGLDSLDGSTPAADVAIASAAIAAPASER